MHSKVLKVANVLKEKAVEITKTG